jgi:hypothetical protein
MGEILSLFSEEKLLSEAADDTVLLIHSTKKVPAIKILVVAHEILILNLELVNLYHAGPLMKIWDVEAFKDLDRIRVEVLVKWADSFKPPILVPAWYQKLGSLFSVLNLGLKNK